MFKRKQLSSLIVVLAGVVGNAAHSQSSLPDWSGVWAMVGGTVFDSASQTGQGRSTTPGVREHPPYTAEYEAKYLANLKLRDDGILPDPNSLCGISTLCALMAKLANIRARTSFNFFASIVFLNFNGANLSSGQIKVSLIAKNAG